MGFEDFNVRSVTKIAALFLVVVILGAPSAANARRGTKAKALQAGVFLYSLTTGAQLFVDGQEIGAVPVEGLIPLTPGEHTLKLKCRGYAHRTEVVDLSPGEELELEWDLVPFAGVVRITSNVNKAVLWLDGKPFGDIPFDGEIPMGNHTLKGVSPGFRAIEKKVEINGGEEYLFHLELEVAPVMPVAAPMEGGSYSERWFWTTAGAVILGGIITGLVLSSGDDAIPPLLAEETLVF